VNDLLDVGRITQGQLRLEKSEVSLSAVIEQAVEQTRPLIDQREHSLSVRLPSRAVKVEADPVRLAQVFSNLLHNAAKYTPNGGSVSIEADVQDRSVTVSVRDSGSGIPPAMLGTIFELFAQLPRSLARSDGGLGIGLTLVKRLTEMHGGSVSAFSDGAGAGSEFRVSLPTLESRSTLPSEPPAKHTVAGSCRVLVVDDNRDANESIGMILEAAGHQVVAAYDGPAALDLARSCLADAVLLDVGLPGMDGYEVVRRLKADPMTRHLFVIALTGYGQPSDVLEAKNAGFDHHLLKPARPEDVLTLLAAVAARKLH
jgi:CheY-like chemotaxis protein